MFLPHLGAVGALATNPQNTVNQLKRLLGKRFNDPAVQRDLAGLPYKVVEGPRGEPLLEVQYLDKTQRFTAEQLMAALLVDLRAMAEREQGSPVTDCVVAVPVYYTEAERYAMLAATQTAGLNCLRLLDETTATALAFGIYKTELPDAEALNIVFVDVGHASTQVCVAALKKGQLAVLGNAWDRDLGGRDFDQVLFDHFAAEFAAKHKVDVRASARSSYRLLRACERTKRVLTTNPEAPINVESLTPDVDANGMITRDAFEEAAKPILDRLLVPVQRAVEAAGLAPAQVASVEVVGGSTRVPAVLRLLGDYFGREPSRTLNSKETPARGCALQAAMLSPAFKVREFQVQDAFPYGVQFSWEKDGETQTSVVFERGSHVPSAKMLTFYRAGAFEITAEYTPDSDIPPTADRKIGTWKIGPFSLPAGADKAKIKVKVVLNLNGIVAVESVNAVEEEEVPAPAVQEETPAAADAPMGEAGAPADAPEDAAEPATDAAAAAPEAAPAKKKTRTRKTPVPFTAHTAEPSKEDLQRLYEAECEMALQARVQAETNDARNSVETYVYSLRNRLADALSPYVAESKRGALVAALDGAEDWLYGDGEDQTKSVYVAKLAELQKLGSPVEERAAEDAARPAAAAALRQAATRYADAARGGDPRLAHLSAEELDRVATEATAALSWLADKEAAQAAQSKHDDPVLRAADISRRGETLALVCDPILTKPPPKPEPTKSEPAVPAAEGEAAAEGQGAEDMEADGAEVGPQPAPEQQADEPMQA